MVGLNYKLKERTVRENREKGKDRQVIKTSSVSFTEGRGAFSTIVSASCQTSKTRGEV